MANNKLQTKEETSALVPKALTSSNFTNLKSKLLINLGANAQLSFSDLTRISMPSGGGTVWQVPTSDGEVENVEEIVGVVVDFADGKSFWQKSLDDGGGNAPPDCWSNDTEHGLGNPYNPDNPFGEMPTEKDDDGWLCDTCPNNEYKSAKKGAGKACKDLRNLYILTESSILPKVIVVPPTSLKDIRKRFVSFAVEDGIEYWGVLVGLRLVTDKNDANIKYSKIAISKKAILDAEAYERATTYNGMIKDMLSSMSMSRVTLGETTQEAEAEL